MGRRWVYSRLWKQNLKETDRKEDADVDGRIILKLILEKKKGGELNLSVSGYGAMAGSFEHGNEPTGSLKF
jgi:hypothetical protein